MDISSGWRTKIMDRQNFVGQSGFVWWVGEIVRRDDPLGVGRCRVRIFGVHTENKSLLPDEELPWATPLYPVNNSKKFEAPKVGEWVVGFFMDGQSCQFPIMMGVLPGLQQGNV